MREAFNVPGLRVDVPVPVPRAPRARAPPARGRLAGCAAGHGGPSFAAPLSTSACHSSPGPRDGARASCPRSAPARAGRTAAALAGSLSPPREAAGAFGINSVSTPQVSDAALAILSAGGGSLDGYILQADMSTARDELRTLLPGDEFVTDRGNILLAISKRN